MAEQFTSQEQFLIQRLQRAPQPTLSPERFSAIRVSLFEAMDRPPLPSPRTALRFSAPVVVAAVIVIVVVITVVLVASGVFSPTPIPTTTIAPTQTASPIVTQTPSPTPTASSTSTSTPEATPETTQEPVLVVEGPISSINGNIITIFGVEVIINPSDPMLSAIQVGDVVHIEGSNGTAGIIVATNVTTVNVEVNVNPADGTIWRDDGNCDHPPPDWAPAHGWRRRCQGQDSNSSQDHDHGKEDGND